MRYDASRGLFDLIGDKLPALEDRWISLSMDPTAFSQMPPRQQTEMRALSELVPLLRWLRSEVPTDG